jgi:hypothetical protein
MLKQYTYGLRADDAGADAGGGAAVAGAPAATDMSDAQFNTAFRDAFKQGSEVAAPPAQNTPAPKADASPAAPAKEKVADAADILGLGSEKKAAPEAEPAKPAGLDTSKEFQAKLSGPSDRSSEATKTNWKQLNEITDAVRAERDAIKAEKARLEAELSEARKLIGNPDELKRIKEEHNYALEKLKVISVKDHPEFKAKFTEPKNQLTDKAAKLLADYEVSGVDVKDIAGKSRKQFAEEVTEIAGQLPEFERHVFIDDMRKLRDLSEAEGAELARSGELASQYQQKTVNQQRGVFEKLWSEGQGSALKPKEIPATATPEERKDLEEYNSGISNIRAEAEKFLFNPYNEESAAKMALKASTLDFMVTKGIPKLNGYIQSQAARIAELEAEVAGMRAHGPGSFDGGNSSSAKTEVSDADINAAFRSGMR